MDRSSLIKAIAVLGSLTISNTAAADARVDEADRLFQQGRQLVAAGRLAEACAAFDASQQLAPATTTLFNQADCREKANQIATAWRLFVEAEHRTRSATDTVGMRLHGVAVDRVSRLAPRLSRLTIVIADPEGGLIVLRDGDLVAKADWNHAVPIDGGSYVLVAKREDREVWRETIVVASEAANLIVRMPRPPTVSAEPKPVIALQASLGDSRARVPRSRRSAVLATGGAVLLLGGALGFERWGSSIYSEAVATNDEALRRSANTRRYAAQSLLGAGLGCAGVATWLWLRDPGERAPAPRATRVDPIVGPGVVGLRLEGSF